MQATHCCREGARGNQSTEKIMLRPTSMAITSNITRNGIFMRSSFRVAFCCFNSLGVTQAEKVRFREAHCGARGTISLPSTLRRRATSDIGNSSLAASSGTASADSKSSGSGPGTGVRGMDMGCEIRLMAVAVIVVPPCSRSLRALTGGECGAAAVPSMLMHRKSRPGIKTCLRGHKAMARSRAICVHMNNMRSSHGQQSAFSRFRFLGRLAST